MNVCKKNAEPENCCRNCKFSRDNFFEVVSIARPPSRPAVREGEAFFPLSLSPSFSVCLSVAAWITTSAVPARVRSLFAASSYRDESISRFSPVKCSFPAPLRSVKRYRFVCVFLSKERMKILDRKPNVVGLQARTGSSTRVHNDCLLYMCFDFSIIGTVSRIDGQRIPRAAVLFAMKLWYYQASTKFFSFHLVI